MKSVSSALIVISFAACAAMAAATDANDGTYAGRFPSPSLDESGKISFLYQDAMGAIRLGTADSPEAGGIVRQGGSARIPLSPRLKQDRSGTLWAVWAEGDGLIGEIVYGRVDGGGTVAASSVGAGPGTIRFPDLDFDASNGAWLAWARESGRRAAVCVRHPGSGRIVEIGSEGLAAVSGVRILAGGPAGIWLFWSGRGSGRDEIFWSRFDGASWSPAAGLNRDNGVPHLFPEAVLDASGNPRLVWSVFNGSGYRIAGSRWDGASWSPEEMLTRAPGSDAFPAVAFADRDEPLLIWSRTSGARCILCAKPLGGTGADREIEILSAAPGAVTGLEIAARDGTLAVLWQTGDVFRARSFSREEILAGSEPRDETAFAGAVAATEEDVYVAFGDDNTYGVIDGGPASDLGYVPRLEEALVSMFGQAEIWNEGVTGESTVGGLGRIGDVLAARKARYVLLMEGTNDVVISGISADATAFNIEQMIRRCVEARALPVLASIIPRSDAVWDQPIFRQKLYDINDRIAIAAVNRKIPSVDMFNAFWDYAGAGGDWTALLSDGVHPNALGYGVIAAAWAGAVRDIPFPPGAVAVARTTERSLVMNRSLNYLTWSHSLKIADPFLFRSYRIYRRDLSGDASGYELVAGIPYSPFHAPQKYNDLDIDRTRRYEYAVTLLRTDGVEGPLSDPAAESD